jgi:hypothetical protein
MKPAEQTAYWKHQAQKHETRNRELMSITGGKHGDALRKEIEELGTLRTEKLTPSEQALEAAKAAARGELLPQLAETAFRVAIGTRKTEAEVDDFVADLNLDRFIKDGKVDTAKVLERVQQYAPDKDTGTPRSRDFGQGKRGSGQKSGVARWRRAVRAATQEAHIHLLKKGDPHASHEVRNLGHRRPVLARFRPRHPQLPDGARSTSRAFTAGTHYPNGYIPSGTPVAIVGGLARALRLARGHHDGCRCSRRSPVHRPACRRLRQLLRAGPRPRSRQERQGAHGCPTRSSSRLPLQSAPMTIVYI